jgi:hypothetical protein
VIGDDAAALRALARQGAVLADDPRAQAILARIEARAGDGDSAWSFYRKAVVSGPGLYAVAIAFGAGALSDRLTKALMPGSFPRRRVRLAWLDGEILARGVSRASWKGMHARARRAAEATQKLTHDLIQWMLDQAVREEAEALVRSRLDDLYREALKSKPPRGRRWRADEIRLMAAEQPAFVTLVRPAPVVALAAPAESPAPQPAPALPAPAALELVSAARREGGGDPLVRLIDNEDEAARYAVERSGPQPVSAPQVDVSRLFRSSWDGGRSGSLWR